MKEALVVFCFFSVCLGLVCLNLLRGSKAPKIINDPVRGKGLQFNAVSINSFLEKTGPLVTVGFETKISPRLRVFGYDMDVSLGGAYKTSEVERVKYERNLLVWRVLIFFKTEKNSICVILKKKELALELVKSLKAQNHDIKT